MFEAVSNAEVFCRALPHVVRTEYLSEHKSGVGTRFRETRLVRGKSATTELEVTEYVENQRVRAVADTHGTMWDSEFSVVTDGDATELSLELRPRSARPWPSIMNPLMRVMLGRALGQDLDALRDFCEAAERRP